jgi:DNA segregation ATPase FtsK/SpoIIIE-like protein
MDKTQSFIRPWLGRLALALPALVLGLTLATPAQAQQEDPPGRVANLSWRDGGVVFAPAGEEEWTDLPVNRPLTRGDRLWTDRGARAELQLGSATLQLDDESHLGITELDDDAAQLILQQGALNARVRELDPGENFEVDTPNLAFRAHQPGDYRIDVSPDGVTRVIVRSGQGTVFGEGGRSLPMAAGQAISFGGRALAQVADPFGGRDGFDRWVAERNQREDQSVAARHIPRTVIGYSQLDPHGTWETVPEYGTVWYPRVTVADWAPYRYGHWSWIQPWGWTWVDDAPWGFAPFHYGRWAQIGPRWAWVPGRFERRPAYAPALVVFLGGSSGGTNWSLSVGSGPGVAWYPLAPGEYWRPSYRTSSLYLTRINRDWRERRDGDYHFRRQASALTAVPLDDFRHGRPVRSHWRPIAPSAVARATPWQEPVRPVREREMWRGERPRLQAQPPAVQAGVTQPWMGRRGFAGNDDARSQQERAQREQERAQREQQRLQRDAQRQPGDPDRQRGPRDAQRFEQGPRDAQRQQQERAEREARQQQHEQSVRAAQERQQQEQRARQERERAEREARQQQHQQSVRAMQERQQQERAQREQQRQQQEQAMRGIQERQQQQERLQEQGRQQLERAQRDAAQRQQQQQQQEQAQRAQERQRQQLQQQQDQAARQQERQRQEQQGRAQQEQQLRQQMERAQREAAQRQQIAPVPQPQGRGDDGRAQQLRQQGQGQGQGQGRGPRDDDDEQRGRARALGRNG